jgi:UTP--glucose-1-phosphate uridylyltransferase
MSDNTEASKTVTKAVIPAAGMGTRLEPLTNHLSKELLPVGGKPMIQHTIEMCMASGISELCIITPHTSRFNGILGSTGNWHNATCPS